MCSGKGKQNTCRMCEEFVRKLAGWHLATSLRNIFFTENFKGVLIK